MRRIIALTILIVLLSSLLNLAIALGFWWFGKRPPTPTVDITDYGIVDPRPRDLAVWRNRRGLAWPPEPDVATRHNYLGITFRSLLWNKIDWSGPIEDADSNITKVDNYSIDMVELGWPLRCIAGERWNEWHGPPAPIQSTSGMFVAFSAQWPNRVLWLGMVMNEVFYGAVIALSFVAWIHRRRVIRFYFAILRPLLRGPFALRRHLRRKRGLCVACGYDLRGDLEHGCPECGWQREAAS